MSGSGTDSVDQKFGSKREESGQQKLKGDAECFCFVVEKTARSQEAVRDTGS